MSLSEYVISRLDRDKFNCPYTEINPNVPDIKVILEYTHGKAVPVSAKVHRSVFKDERISNNLTKILKRKVVLPTNCDSEWYEFQGVRE